MRTLYLYGPRHAGQAKEPAYLLPSSSDERESWSGYVAQMPRLEADGRRGFVDDYRSIMDRLDLVNQAKDGYWYSALGSRNTQNSRLYQGLEQLWRLDRLLRHEGGESSWISLVVPDRRMVPLARSLCRARGWAARDCGGWPPRRPFDPLRGPWGALRYLLGLCDFGRGHGDFGPSGNDVIVATVTTRSLLQAGRTDRDLIFGALPVDLARAGYKVLKFAQVTGDIAPPAVPARALEGLPIRTLIDLARPIDAVRAVVRAALWRPRTGAGRSRLGIDVTALARIDATASRWRDLPIANFLRQAFLELLRRSPGAVLLHPFENNGWEHACTVAARSAGNRIAAFQHNALLKSSEKTFASRYRPIPDRIIAMGPGAKSLLVDVFGYSPANITAGYSIRQNAIYCHAARTSPPERVRRLLVLLQGVAESVELIDCLASVFQANSHYGVTLRPHPAIPLEVQLARSTMRILRPPFGVSDEPDLHLDILAHDAVLFTSSTAGWEAVALGVPAIHVDLGHAGASCPMFAEPALCRTALDGASLMRAIGEIEALSPAKFDDEAKRARRFFETCFAPKSETAFKAVLANLGRRGEN